MRVRKVNRYYCEFCKKANCSRSSISKHERRCTLNPNRECGMCALAENAQHPLTELIAILPRGGASLTTPDPDGYPYELANRITEELKTTLPKLRELAGNCPACIMAALRQAKIPVPMVDGFDFKTEGDAILSAYRTREHEEYMRNVSCYA